MQSQAISYFNTMITRIEATPGYQQEMPVVYIGSEEKYVPNLYSHQKYPNITLSPYSNHDAINMLHWRKFVSNWCGFEPKEIDSKYFVNLQEVQTMPLYPDDGSIRIINDTIVIKFR